MAAIMPAPGRVCQSVLVAAAVAAGEAAAAFSALRGLRALSTCAFRFGEGSLEGTDAVFEAMKLVKVAVRAAIWLATLPCAAMLAACALAASCCMAVIMPWMDSISCCCTTWAAAVSSWNLEN